MTEVFGRLPDGRPVEVVTLRAGGLMARVLTLGAIVQDLRLEGVGHPLVLGCPDIDAYFGPGRYFGAIAGRFANRIGGARFALDGHQFQTDPNFLGRHTLHGGADGMDIQPWQIEAQDDDSVTLSLTESDGHMGFPGTLRAEARISLTSDALRFDLSATSDKATPCTLTHHGYFDLDGAGDVRTHSLQIDAGRYLPLDADLIPTGEFAPVAGTPFDFRTARTIGDHGYDVHFCLSDAPQPLRKVAEVRGTSGVTLTVETTACGLQVYDGGYMTDVPGLEGRRYHAHAGLALEAQSWPDAPNRPQFPSAILRPGETWAETTVYRFSR